MPGGSQYPGPSEALEKYTAAVNAGAGDSQVKGAKNPYTSRNGHMFSFLDADGSMALRLSDELGEEFLDSFNSGPVIQYNSVMRGYVSVPADMLANTSAIAAWFDKSFEWIGSLRPRRRRRRELSNYVIDLQPDLELTTAQAERVLEVWLAGPVRCSKILSLEGGLVNSVFELEFDRPPHRAVVKLHGTDGDTFTAEARALEYLRAQTTCPVPHVYLHDSSGRVISHAFLLLELVPGVCLDNLELDSTERTDVDEQLAAVLGELHNNTRTRWGGVDTEGATVWPDIFTERLRAARADPALAERLESDVLTRVDEAIDLAPSALRDSGTPTLVHGDIWDGNLMVVREDGRWRLTGLLDPDLQFADVELELAYLEVFDHSREAFFAAYADHQTLRPGYDQRRLFYWLHTALVHVALFGEEFFCEYTARTAESIGQLQAS